MIESISIAGVANFDATGIKIENLRKIGFIYGENGTGKTTIAKLLADGSQPEFASCSVTWKEGSTLQTLVYNSDFRDRNFGPSKLDGIFTLGEATKEQREALEVMSNKLLEIKARGLRKKATLEQLNKEKTDAQESFSEGAWDNVFKKHKTHFKDAFRGVMSKRAFCKKLLAEAASNNTPLKTQEELEATASTIFGSTPIKLPLISQINCSNLFEMEGDPIWEKRIVGKSDIDLAKLIQILDINDWVNEGRNFIRNQGICPFCQEQTISENFREKLALYFDQTFDESLQRVKKITAEYAFASQKLVHLLEGIESKEKVNPDSKLKIDLFRAELKTTVAQLRTNGNLMEGKCKEPSRSVKLTSLKAQLERLVFLVDTANAEIEKHNKIVDNYDTEKTDLINAIWRFLCVEYQPIIDHHIGDISIRKKEIEVINGEKNELLKEYTELNSRIKDANKNVTSIQPSIDEINKTLKESGFSNFKIVPCREDKNQYQIQRENGLIVDSTLSEGEITFITFLYFLQRAKGGITKSTVTEERVLVIDDPISSLDVNLLSVVSTLIKELLDSVKNDQCTIKQVLLLTHNVYFHKEVSHTNGMAIPNTDTNFWILHKKNKISQIQSFLMENPIS